MNELDDKYLQHLYKMYKTCKGVNGDYTITERQWKDEEDGGTRHEGGMGFVCTGNNVKTQEEVIIKIPLARKLDIIALKKEAYILRSIKEEIEKNNYSIVRYIDEAANPNKNFFLVLESLGDKSLWDRVGKGNFNPPLDEETVIKFSKEISRSLYFLHDVVLEHDYGVYHRDLKPTNLMVVKRGGEEHCILIDFGVAKRNWRSQDTIHQSGSPGYSCPHQFNDGKGTQECDLYALGRVMFFMSTGEDPNLHTEEGGKCMKIKAAERGAGKILSELIDELVKYPKHKIQTAGRVLERLEALRASVSPQLTVPFSKIPAPPKQEPHIIMGNQRIPIKNGHCEIGREHKCPEREEWSKKKVKPDCSRNLIHRDMNGFKWPLGPASRKNQTNIEIPLTKMGSYSKPRSIAEAHHMRIWKENENWYVMDLDTDARSAIRKKSGWIPLLPMNPYPLDEEYVRLAIGWTNKNGSEIEFSFYKQ